MKITKRTMEFLDAKTFFDYDRILELLNSGFYETLNAKVKMYNIIRKIQICRKFSIPTGFEKDEEERLFEYVKQMKGNYKEIETFIGKYIIKELNRLNKVCQFMFFDLDENDPNMIPFLNSFTFYLEQLNNWQKAKKEN